MIKKLFSPRLKIVVYKRKIKEYIVINNLNHPDNAGQGRVSQDTLAQEKGKADRKRSQHHSTEGGRGQAAGGGPI
jgi:hypothetical protein